MPKNVRYTKQINSKLELKLQKYYEELLRAEIRWNYAFGTTIRYNGMIVEGNPRNTIDTRNTFKKLRVDITGETNRKITIRFLDESAKYIFGEKGHRSEFFEYALPGMIKRIGKEAVEAEIDSRLGRKSTNAIIPIQKGKLYRKSRAKK